MRVALCDEWVLVFLGGCSEWVLVFLGECTLCVPSCGLIVGCCVAVCLNGTVMSRVRTSLGTAIISEGFAGGLSIMMLVCV